MARHPSMTAQEFVDKWRRSHPKESSGAQEHFIDRRRLAACRWPHEPTTDNILERLLALNPERAAKEAS